MDMVFKRKKNERKNIHRIQYSLLIISLEEQ